MSSGHIAFVRDQTLWVVPFDVGSLALGGEAVPIVESIHTHGIHEGSQFAISRAGSLAYSSGRASDALVTRLVSVDRAGRATALPHEPNDYAAPRISPDGLQLAVSLGSLDYDIWVLDLVRPARSRLTFDLMADVATWTPDGERIAFSSRISAVDELFWTSTDGSGDVEEMLEGATNARPSSFSPDGKTLLYIDLRSSANRDIWTLTMGGEPAAFVVSPFNDRFARFSPDGRWVAYVSNRSGRDELYVRAYPDGPSDIQVTTDGGIDPVWSPVGGELFFRSGGKMMAVPIRQRPEFGFGEPRLLFEGAYRVHGNAGSYDVTRDGQHFIMLPLSEGASTAQLEVVLHWIEEVKRLVPTEE